MNALKIRKGPCRCGNDECDKIWARDPMLEVICPDCLAPIGSDCRRPSGHSGPFVDGHAARDLSAYHAGHYGECPLGCCGLKPGNTKADQCELAF